jgi:hypothetical protein
MQAVQTLPDSLQSIAYTNYAAAALHRKWPHDPPTTGKP